MAKVLDRDRLLSFAERARPEFESVLESFIEVPSVSSDPARKEDIRRCADLAVQTIRRFGGEPRVYETRGNPLVHGIFNADPALPTVTIYNHLDVQPASRDTEPWETDPFKMAKKGDRYFGRGTTDDKGPAMSALFGARAARELGVPVNIQLLWELEEEIGSPSFEAGIVERRRELATDSVVVSDTIWVSRERPAAPAGLRGLVGMLLKLETGTTDQHSGTAGGAARNPLGELMGLVCDIYDPQTGKVKIPGFYDDVVEPTDAELRDFEGSGFSVAEFKKDHLFKSLRTEEPLDVMKRIWAMPTFEVHGLVGGYSGPGVKTIIPPRGELKVTCRLVPNQSPEKAYELVKAFVKQRNPDVKVEPEGMLAAYRGQTTGPLADAVRRSIAFAFGQEPVFVREGGSIGAVLTMEKVLGVPVMFLGLSLPEHGYHAPNENFDWRQAAGGMVAFAKYFDEVSRLPRPAKR
jgi:acetylornithine deacetylase/succinyl-diaminopimelate desuccinylase-like protein